MWEWSEEKRKVLMWTQKWEKKRKEINLYGEIIKRRHECYMRRRKKLLTVYRTSEFFFLSPSLLCLLSNCALHTFFFRKWTINDKFVSSWNFFFCLFSASFTAFYFILTFWFIPDKRISCFFLGFLRGKN